MAKSANSYNIIRRNDGRWYTQVMCDGERIQMYGKTKTEVLNRLKQKLWEIEQAKAAKLANFAQSERMTVEQWARQCLETYSRDSVKPNTYAGYLSIVEHHLDGIGEMKLGAVTNANIQKHLQDKARSSSNENGLGEKTLTNIKAFLNLIFKQAVINGFILRNPVTGVKIPKAGTRERRALTVEEQHRLLDAARNYPRPIMFSVVFTLYTGCRKGEVLGLQWKNVFFEENRIHIGQQFNRHYDMDSNGNRRSVLEVTSPKTKQSVRDIYICDSFAKEFYEYKQRMIEWKKQNRFPHSEEDFVFVGVKNLPIEPRVFYKYYEEVLENAGIEEADFHTLRHTFTTRCIESGMDILMVAKTLGHANVAMTLNQYSHLLPKHMKASMEKMEAGYY